MADELLTTKRLSERTGFSESYFEKKRIYGDGPEYLKVGHKVLYRWSDVECWLEAGRRKNTSENRTQVAA